jgi:predicted unusual protein kinase regulating ubiquinone biosynthesis (AarF/ABC1/UbiB family)
METNLRLALKTLHRLGYLRGAMVKVGQAAANFPGMLPREIAETLEKLHFEAPPMYYSLIREMLSNELKGDPAEVFASFEQEAFAAASLGQVHRATLKSGEKVAVKIQYPGIARTIDADFRNLAALLFPLRLGSGWESIQGSFEEIRSMLEQEVDYEREADNLRQVAALFQPEDGILVPRVYPEYSTKKVLTTAYLPGLHLKDFLATDPSQESRNAFGRLRHETVHGIISDVLREPQLRRPAFRQLPFHERWPPGLARLRLYKALRRRGTRAGRSHREICRQPGRDP